MAKKTLSSPVLPRLQGHDPTLPPHPHWPPPSKISMQSLSKIQLRGGVGGAVVRVSPDTHKHRSFLLTCPQCHLIREGFFDHLIYKTTPSSLNAGLLTFLIPLTLLYLLGSYMCVDLLFISPSKMKFLWRQVGKIQIVHPNQTQNHAMIVNYTYSGRNIL